MTLIHKLFLYGLLGLLSVSFIIPGIVLVLYQDLNDSGLQAETRNGKNQLRGLYGMMVGIGVIALWACWDLQHSRSLVLALGIIMALLVVARSYSFAMDGALSLMARLYLGVEFLMAVVFLFWPPAI